MRILGAPLVLVALIACHAPAFAADPLPKSGSAKLAAYAVCRSLAIVDMGPVGSNSSAECIGIVKTRDGSKLLDNLAIRCLEEAKARPEGYAFTGTCVQTDADGDKLFMTYEGPESGDSRMDRRNGQVQRYHRLREPGASPTRRATRRASSPSRSLTMRPGRRRRSECGPDEGREMRRLRQGVR